MTDDLDEMVILPSETDDPGVEIRDTGTAIEISPLAENSAPPLPAAAPPSEVRVLPTSPGDGGVAHADTVDDSDRFLSWWTSVVDVVIGGIYHEDPAVRRNVIRAIVPLSERFGSKHMATIPLETPRLQELNEKYRVLLEIDRQGVNASVTESLERISRLAETCIREHSRARETSEGLVKAAEVLLRRYPAEGSKKVIGEQLLRCVTLVENERNLRLQVARFQARIPRKVPQVDTHDIRADIAHTEADLQASFPEVLAVMRQWYAAQRENIDYEVAELVRRQCKDVWLEGLRAS
jgi:hypothetical protein